VPQEVLDGWKGSSFGPTWDSYVVGGQPWALPVDAATQVSVLRPDLLGPDLPASDAALLLLTGDPVDAAEAHRIGLVSRVYSPEELVPAARSLALTIAARPPVAAQAAKANLLAARSMGLEQAIQYEREMQAICMGTRDAAEGRSAFAEKRAPTITGH
jgi:enoyl-CoA hydratase/carnithine racemase